MNNSSSKFKEGEKLLERNGNTNVVYVFLFANSTRKWRGETRLDKPLGDPTFTEFASGYPLVLI